MNYLFTKGLTLSTTTLELLLNDRFGLFVVINYGYQNPLYPLP